MKEPALVCTYGPSGSGKTTDLGYSFPNGVFMAARGALQPVRSLCGYEPHAVEAQIIDDATAFLEKLAKTKDHGYDAVLVDDFSFLAEQQFAVYDKRFSGFKIVIRHNDFSEITKLSQIPGCLVTNCPCPTQN